MKTILSRSPAETEAAGEALAPLLRAGAVVAFSGGLGLGKTAFVRGLARGLGYEGDVTSPTFAIINEYRGGRLSLCHMDAYRLFDADSLPDIGFHDYLDGGWAAAVEWSERLGGALNPAFEVKLRRLGDDEREIIIKGAGL